MKILHLNTYDVSGGAARAVYRIHTALRSSGLSSSMLVARKDSDDPDVYEYRVPWHDRKLRWVKKIVSYQSSVNPASRTCNLFPSGIHKVINNSDSDIVHFHWIGDELISIAEVKKIKKPIVWTLHDMWAFSGTEHCDDLVSPCRYKEKYCKRNRPPSHGGRIDVDAMVWRRKKRNWRDVNFSFVTPSRWLAQCLSESALFRGARVSVIPNCLDTEVFQPVEQKASRDVLGLPQNTRLILFGAAGGGINPLKGYHLFEKALDSVVFEDSGNSVECIVFGGKVGEMAPINGVEVTGVGWISDQRKLAMLYSAADIFVSPSMSEAFGQTVTEAMGCATPVVGFNVGGFRDIIDHKKNGFLAESFKADELAQGICWLLEDSQRLKELGHQAREKVLRNYSPSIVVAQYKAFYRHVLQQNQ